MCISQVSIKLHKIYYQADCFFLICDLEPQWSLNAPGSRALSSQAVQHPALPHGSSPLSSLLSPHLTSSFSLLPINDPDSSSTKRIESVIRRPPTRPLHFAPYTCHPACHCKVFPQANPSTCALNPLFLL